MAGTTAPEANFSVTKKDGHGDLWTFRGQTFDELRQRLEEVFKEPTVDKMLADLEDRAAGAAPTPSSQPQGSSGGGGSKGTWADNPPVCSHGTMRAQEYTAKSGPKQGQQQYTFFCPQPREAPSSDKCSPVDGITRKAWGSK